MTQTSVPFALLDDRDGLSRLYEGYHATLRCDDAAELPQFFAALSASGKHAVGLFSYELGAQMQGIEARDDGTPWAECLLFERCRLLSAEAVDEWLLDQWLLEQESHEASAAGAARESPVGGIGAIRPSVDEARFAADIARIRDYIAAGDTYQVNYTMRLHFTAFGHLAHLYRRLRARQMVPYGALVLREDGSAVLSRSPELFVRHANGLLTAQPMKGTAAAQSTNDGSDADADANANAALALSLSHDAKNRAENLMIVDLLRNDLGRIARTGSVKVPALFDVQRYADVLQMTSTITAIPRDGMTLCDVFAALFPCGSITGAPKRRTMQIVRELETEARGLYTGAIGWFAPADASAASSLPEFCLSVPIRTLTLSAEQDGVRRGCMGVGAGIVHDSLAAEEYAECWLKARFLTGLHQEFELFETMRAQANEAHDFHVALLEQHLARLGASARFFGLPFDAAAARHMVRAHCDAFDRTALSADKPHRLRLALRDGVLSLQSAPLAPLAEPVRLQLAAQPMQHDDLFLRHKSTQRARYDAAWRAAEADGAFDQLFFNQRGELTEGGRCNIFVQIDGHWFTPPVCAGVLPGVMRAELLAGRVHVDGKALHARERSISRDDLFRAQEIIVCNALRGVLRAQRPCAANLLAIALGGVGAARGLDSTAKQNTRS